MSGRLVDLEPLPNPSVQFTQDSVAINEDLGASGQHDCCPDESLSLAEVEHCESCVDDLLAESRLQFADTTSPIVNELFDRIDRFFHDSLVHYWRYRETLWWGISQPIYLLIGLFLE